MPVRERRGERAYVPLTIDERERFGAAAAKARMPLAAWLRALAEKAARR